MASSRLFHTDLSKRSLRKSLSSLSSSSILFCFSLTEGISPSNICSFMTCCLQSFSRLASSSHLQMRAELLQNCEHIFWNSFCLALCWWIHMHMQEKQYLLCIHSGRLIWFPVYDAAAYFAMKALKNLQWWVQGLSAWNKTNFYNIILLYAHVSFI